ncbi:MAG: MotA/TolQ/ExbB proton channel family protein [Eubacteriales bacterium]|nr:MotA/TolQ/ExbB proton channel family protein [Eubacteriales bacterium]
MREGMPMIGTVVVIAILALFAAAVVMLAYLAARYRRMQRLVAEDHAGCAFLEGVKRDFAAVYRQNGSRTNTPAVINNAMAAHLRGLLFCERLVNNAVSLFVTLGLFGTFLGLTLSVQSLTELIGANAQGEWLSVLDNVGGGLLSALSGMGVAFYTSLVGVACSILFTFLRTVMSPQAQRERLEVMTELWLDHYVAPELETDALYDDVSMVRRLKVELRAHADAVENALNRAVEALNGTLSQTEGQLSGFADTVSKFNQGTRDFGEISYDLRGSIERMDVSFRDLNTALRGARGTEGRQ